MFVNVVLQFLVLPIALLFQHLFLNITISLEDLMKMFIFCPRDSGPMVLHYAYRYSHMGQVKNNEAKV